MRPAGAVAELDRLGLTLELHGDHLLVTPRERITTAARAMIIEHRNGLLDLLREVEPLATRIADLADAYAELMAIVMEAGGISEAEARRIAEAEIGAAFVRAFLPGEVMP